MEIDKKYSLDAKDLLTESETYEIKAGENTQENLDITIKMCISTCVACTSCVSCTTKMMI